MIHDELHIARNLVRLQQLSLLQYLFICHSFVN